MRDKNVKGNHYLPHYFSFSIRWTYRSTISSSRCFVLQKQFFRCFDEWKNFGFCFFYLIIMRAQILKIIWWISEYYPQNLVNYPSHSPQLPQICSITFLARAICIQSKPILWRRPKGPSSLFARSTWCECEGAHGRSKILCGPLER
jgi:hypothetical protein